MLSNIPLYIYIFIFMLSNIPVCIYIYTHTLHFILNVHSYNVKTYSDNTTTFSLKM